MKKVLALFLFISGIAFGQTKEGKTTYSSKIQKKKMITFTYTLNNKEDVKKIDWNIFRKFTKNCKPKDSIGLKIY